MRTRWSESPAPVVVDQSVAASAALIVEPQAVEAPKPEIFCWRLLRLTVTSPAVTGPPPQVPEPTPPVPLPPVPVAPPLPAVPPPLPPLAVLPPAAPPVVPPTLLPPLPVTPPVLATSVPPFPARPPVPLTPPLASPPVPGGDPPVPMEPPVSTPFPPVPSSVLSWVVQPTPDSAAPVRYTTAHRAIEERRGIQSFRRGRRDCSGAPARWYCPSASAFRYENFRNTGRRVALRGR